MINERYNAKVREKDYDGTWKEKQFQFTTRDFQKYISAKYRGHSLADKEPRSADKGKTRERIISDLYEIKGYRTMNLAVSSLRTESDKLPYPLKKLIKEKITKDLSEISRAGLPDLIVYKIKPWHHLSNHIPPIHDIRYDEESKSISFVSEIDDVPADRLIEDWQFVEVKSWKDSLNPNQEEWFEEFGYDLNARVFKMKHLEVINEGFKGVDLENPWRLEEE